MERISGVFVGRESELALARSALQDARSGRGRILLVTGEPGVGKSWLAEELALEARQSGTHTAWGRCYEGAGAPAFFAWAQVLRSCLRTADAHSLEPLVSSAAANLMHVVPALRHRRPDLPESTSEGPESRLRFFESVARLLEGTGVSVPLLVILDDLHAADRPSLLLFEFLAHRIREMRVLLVATCRDAAMADDDLERIFTEVVREPGTERIELKGFSVAEIADLLQAYTGVPPKGDLPEMLHRKTGGSPLFVSEFVRMLAAEKRLHDASDLAHARLGIPSTVRSVIRQRMAAVSEPCRDVLKIAAVAGHAFSADLLRAWRSTARADFAKSLDEAVAAGILIEAKEAAGRYRFAHAVMRDTLYDELAASERVELHRQVGESIVEDASGDALAEISHHFLEASTIAEPDATLVGKAIDYTQRTAQRAVAVLAYEEGARLYRLAIATVERTGGGDPRQRASLWLGLGEALFRAGDVPLAREAFSEAAALARKLSDPEMFARAVVGSAGRYIEVGVVNARLCELLEEALLRLPEDDSSLRARLLARLAAELAYSKRPERAAELCDLAVSMARRVRDPAALSDAFNASQVSTGALRDPNERLALTAEIIHMAEASDDLESIVEMVGWRVDYLLELGDIRAVDGEIARHARLAERLRQPLYLWLSFMFRAMRALHDGRFDAAEQLATEAVAHGQRAQNPNAMQANAAQIFFIRREQGRLGEWRVPLEAMAAEYSDMPAWRVGLACLYADTGYLLEAKALFDQLAQDDFAAVPQDRAWLMAMTLLSEVAAAVRDAERAATLYALLLPFGDRNVSLTGGAVSVGAVARYLGLLAMTMGREDVAERHFEAALAMHARMAAGPNIAHVQADLADLLLRRSNPNDRARADELLQQACARAEKLGMVKLLERIAALLGESRGPARPSDVAAKRTGSNDRAETGCGIFRKEGDYWTIAFEGEPFRLKDVRGLHYLAWLLRQPGRELHVLDLVAQLPPANGQVPAALDVNTKAAGKRRLYDLREELAEAEKINDLGRSAQARAEIERIVEQLSAEVGLGGRDRQTGAHAERARQTVTKSIKAALAKIEASNPDLAQHLALHVKTGYFCSYVPDPLRPVSWTL